MITFLPYPDWLETAVVLDDKRLGQQRREVKGMLTNLFGGKRLIAMAKMWQGHEIALCAYGIVICQEWEDRGHEENTAPELLQKFDEEVWDVILDISETPQDWETWKSFGYLPDWYGFPSIHESHRLRLLQKNFEHYSQFFDDDLMGAEDGDGDSIYIWPWQIEIIDFAKDKWRYKKR